MSTSSDTTHTIPHASTPMQWSPTDMPPSMTDTLTALPTVAHCSGGCISLNTAYTVDETSHAGDTSGTLNHIVYSPQRDTSQHHVFQTGMVLPESWLRTVVQHTETGGCDTRHRAWGLVLEMAVQTIPDCV